MAGSFAANAAQLEIQGVHILLGLLACRKEPRLEAKTLSDV